MHSCLCLFTGVEKERSKEKQVDENQSLYDVGDSSSVWFEDGKDDINEDAHEKQCNLYEILWI